MPRLQDKYRKEIAPALRKKFGIANVMATPRVTKVMVNTGTGKVQRDAKSLEKLQNDLAILAGQKAAVRKARKSVASFKLREGMPIGYAATLRGKRMYDFLDRLVSLAIPRSKDFRGIAIKNVDQEGNLNFGITEHSIFPEITYESLKDIFSLQVTVVTSTKDREQGIELLRLMGVPLQKPLEK
jgi:large subunit ribosomal protein L5